LSLLAALVTAALALAATPPAASQPEPPRPGFRVIVHPEMSVQSLERRTLSEMFLKKITRWPGGDAIQPVDLAPGSRTRHAFSEDVVGRTVASVKSYWQQIIFTGRGLPPPELADDAAVIDYVLRHTGSIGYVSGTASVGAARVVTIR
jgi:ABC-type phosphate transport system substrate-binding protein